MNEEEFREKNLLTKIPVTTQEDVDRYCEAMKVVHPPLNVNQETIRDRFAMAYLSGTVHGERTYIEVALQAYSCADAMLEARGKK